MIITCPLCNTASKPHCKIDGYKYYLCAKCYLLFLYPQPNNQQLDEYYKHVFTHSAGLENKTRLVKQAKKIVRKLLKHNPKGKTILDIGSGLGYILEEANQKGLKVTAIEPSKNLVKNITYRQFHNVYNSSFDDYIKMKYKEKFDFVTITHVIEHIKEPKIFINNVLNLLNRNGIIFIETPNINSHLYRAEKCHYTFLTPPEHVFLYSLNAISKLLPKPYIIIDKSTYSYPEHFMGILKSILKKNADLKLKSIQVSTETNRKNISIINKIKIFLFDNILAHLFYPLLNLYQYGSVLELYISKK